MLTNSLFESIQFRGRTGPYLEPSPGHATLNLLKMAPEGLVIDVRTAVDQAKKTGATVRKKGLRLRGEGGVMEVNLEVTPIVDPSIKDWFFLVLFQTVEPPAALQKSPPPAPRGKKQKTTEAERELKALRPWSCPPRGSHQSGRIGGGGLRRPG